MFQRRWRKGGHMARLIRGAALLVAAVLAVGISGTEESALREFDDATGLPVISHSMKLQKR